MDQSRLGCQYEIVYDFVEQPVWVFCGDAHSASKRELGLLM